MSKQATLLLIVILTVSSLILVAPAHSSITKPSVPKFTLKLVDHSYDVPATYSIDPYTGENVTHTGYRVENRSIEVTIENQPFTPYVDVGGERVWLFYDVRFKGHFEDWGFYNATSFGDYQHYILMSDSEYTVISYFLQGDADDYSGYVIGEVPLGGKVDFQVQAVVGYVTTVYGDFVPPFGQSYYDVFIGEKSGWSETQTLTIDTPASTTTPMTLPSPSEQPTETAGPQPNPFPTWTIASVVSLAIVGIGLVVRLRKHNSSG